MLVRNKTVQNYISIYLYYLLLFLRTILLPYSQRYTENMAKNIDNRDTIDISFSLEY